MMYRNKIRPHAITFLAWSIILGVNVLVQLASGVGESVSLLIVNLACTGAVFAYCLKKGNTAHDKYELLCLMLAIATLVLWLAADNPLYSVLLSCVMDFFAFVPSFRKSYLHPHEDSALTFFISGLEYLFSFPAYKTFSFIVLAYPVWVLTIDMAYAAFILIRRAILSNKIIWKT
ncbi:MAG TPA: hypothetical protein VEA59_01045 [Patescibacteria group bacterium]|nr:hypothetical protein [Patescibacteria group bacterium]